MTTTTLVAGNRMTDMEARPRRSLEELVDNLIDALFKVNAKPETVEQSATRWIHEARRLRQAGDMDGGLAILADMDIARAETREARWAFSEWTQMVRRRFGGSDVVLYTQGTGRASALVPHGDGTLEVIAALGMRWRPGKVVSERSLRGLRLLNGGA